MLKKLAAAPVWVVCASEFSSSNPAYSKFNILAPASQHLEFQNINSGGDTIQSIINGYRTSSTMAAVVDTINSFLKFLT